MLRSDSLLRRVLIGLVAGVAVVAAAKGVVAYRHRNTNEVARSGSSVVDVATATQAPVDRELAVTGYVFTDAFTGDLLCSERTKGDRPACKGVTARLVQLDPTRLDLVRAEQAKGGFDAWSRDRVVLQVRARRGTLLVVDVLPVRAED